MSQTYLVTLEPVEPYFFGAEYTFSKDDSRKDSSRYNALSTYFPQQTALLGMLRKTLLIQNKNLTMHLKGEWIDSRGGKKGNDKNYHEATALAGNEAFSYERDVNLGIIENISPIFISKNQVNYIINAKDDGYTPKFLDSKMSLNGVNKNTFILDGYNAKEYKDDTFIGTNKTSLNYDDIFKAVQTVGIKKAKDAQTNEDAFFQKTSYILKDKSKFSFFITLSKELSWSETFVTLGADQSSFKLVLKPTSETFETTFRDIFKPKSLSRIVLNSETLINEQAYSLATFILGKRAIYRQLKDRHGTKSKRYYLLEKGSVLYSDDIETLGAKLSQSHLQKVGINNFTIIKGL